MSIYLYTLSPCPKKVKIQGYFTAEFFDFRFVRGNFGAEDDNWSRKKMERAAATWDKREVDSTFVSGANGTKLNEVRFFTLDFQKNAVHEVLYRVENPLLSPAWVDVDPFPGNAKPIGTLTKKGRRWIAEPIRQ